MNFIDTAYLWIAANVASIGITLSIVVVYLLLDRFSTPKLAESADHGGFNEASAQKRFISLGC